MGSKISADPTGGLAGLVPLAGQVVARRVGEALAEAGATAAETLAAVRRELVDELQGAPPAEPTDDESR